MAVKFSNNGHRPKSTGAASYQSGPKTFTQAGPLEVAYEHLQSHDVVDETAETSKPAATKPKTPIKTKIVRPRSKPAPKATPAETKAADDGTEPAGDSK